MKTWNFHRLMENFAFYRNPFDFFQIFRENLIAIFYEKIKICICPWFGVRSLPKLANILKLTRKINGNLQFLGDLHQFCVRLL